MSVLRKRKALNKGSFNRQHPMGKAFHAPQRDHVEKVQHPKPERAA